ncbi:MAG: hypothetical protein AB9866_18750 [Syntrophobacteraceae bacterium]
MLFLSGLFIGCLLGFTLAGLCNAAKAKTPMVTGPNRMPKTLEEVA